ncbi:TPR repeat-containing protein [Tenacibaculum sp. MAR_2009_124]|uniref:tetratricopeptide repeat protein n=1 Tax=Tenacibaculum sp. MAR_2009_124 TaxID=1250059 RepID=UPI000898605C|nr:tetratricopeptide repeat protein [Tenacibaculum sp. MAR_2009_124]SEC40105.1 TPR repeat-containing protein [Tenacibaculum sp. MAR_2009_124]
MQSITVNLHQSASVIIQKLHKVQTYLSIKIKTRLILKSCFVLFLFLSQTVVFAQDSIPVSQDIADKHLLDFQENFFQAITQKAINNFQKAIDNLETCNELKPKNIAVLFELSKNYYKLQRFVEAIAYAEQALEIEPENIWLLEHLVKVHKRNNDFRNAIAIQKKLIQKLPKKKQDLVFLYIQCSQIDSAKIVLNELKSAKMLNARLRYIQKNLNRYSKRKPKSTKPIVKNTSLNNENLELQFKDNKSFVNLKQLLEQLDSNNDSKLLSYSNEGLVLFPAQPFVYLMNAKAFNKSKKHKKALLSLQNGIDFVIDNPTMESRFYNEFVISYQGLGDRKNESKYRKKLNK